MHILKSIIIAFSMYSKIPMPQFEWKEEDMKHVLCFFPWIGIVIGLCLYFWRLLCDRFGIRNLCYVFIGTAIPLLLTGGFHVDGFMDTMDAFHSYQPKERKLEILKDSHIGAFAVIMLAVYGLIYMGAFSEITDKNILQVVCAGFVLARVLSGIGVVSFPSAKKEGMLYLFQDHADAVIVKAALSVQGALCIGFMLWRSLFAGSVAVITAFAVFGYYKYRTKKELGGITGDTAGYFLLLCEGAIVVMTNVVNVLLKSGINI